MIGRKKGFLILIFLMMSAASAFGQTVGEPLSFNFSGLAAVALQRPQKPCPVSFDPESSFRKLNAGNNYLGLKWGSLGGEESSIDDLSTLFKEFAGNENKAVFLRMDVIPPFSFMAALSPRHSIAIQMRSRVIVNADNIHPQMAKMFYENLEYAPLYDQRFSGARLNVRALGFSELGVTYAREIWRRPAWSLKAGITAKYLLGHGGAFMAMDKMDFMFSEGSRLDLQNVEGTFAVADNLTVDELEYQDILFSKNSGWGIDLGATLERRLSNDQAGYRWKVGISLLDLGRVNFKNSATCGSFSGQTDDLFTAINDGLDATDNPILGFCRGWTKVFPTTAQVVTRFSIGLPTMLSLHGDYRLTAHVFVSAIAMLSLVSKNSIPGLHGVNRLEVGIRSEGKLAAVYLPLAIQNNGVEIGTFFRFLGLNIGSSNWLNTIISGNMRQANVLIGLHIPVMRKRAI